MVSYRVPIEQLRGDVRVLGQLLGDILVEQNGSDLLDLVERIRALAIADRARGEPVDSVLVDAVSTLPIDVMENLVRAFTLYFYLVNAAEENHRLRALRQRQEFHPGVPRPESVLAAVSTLRARGLMPVQIQKFLSGLRISPVLTAHPSEARRRTILQHLQRLSPLIGELQSAPTSESVRVAVQETLTLLWQTDQVRVTRPSPLNEVETGIFFFDRTLFDVVPRIYRDLLRALATYYPTERFTIPPFLRFSTWIGGDRDGNPNVTNAVTLDTLALHRAAVLKRYATDVAALTPVLSSSVRRVRVSADLVDSIARKAEVLGDAAQKILTTYPVEPYRQILGLVVEQLRRTEERSVGGYLDSAEFVVDLELVSASLRQHQGERIADAGLQDLIWRARAFGFHLAELEIRQHSRLHQAALEDIFRETEVCLNYAGLSEAEKVNLLAAEIASSRPLIPTDLKYQPATNEIVELFRMIHLAHARFGPDCIRRYVVSMTHGPEDVLAVVLLAKEAGLLDARESRPTSASIQVVPLFEGIDDLIGCGEILERLLVLPVYNDLAARSLVVYRQLIQLTPGFERYFRESTPFPELAQHAIASRPVTRNATQTLEDIRAIPWVFSWTQCRINLPGWFGVGSALHSCLSEHPENIHALRSMYADWPVFRSIIDNCQISVATADLAVARLYRDVVPDASLSREIYDILAAEFERTRSALTEVTGYAEPLGPSSILLQSIRLRNPYVDPMHVVQATLLRAVRRGGLSGERRPVELVLQTINGIAAGLQTTG